MYTIISLFLTCESSRDDYEDERPENAAYLLCVQCILKKLRITVYIQILWIKKCLIVCMSLVVINLLRQR